MTALFYRNPVDGYEMVLIPAGPGVSGLPADRANQHDATPQFEGELPALYVGIYAVTNAQYLRFVESTGHRPPDQSELSHTPAWRGRSFPQTKADHPVCSVSWDDAQAYCRWAGLRLPTELEWERVARGPEGRLFPWGDDWADDRCRHSSETHCPVWEYPEGVSVWGMYNMAGNVWEWCADSHDPGAYTRYARGDLTPPSEGQAKVARGGACHNTKPEDHRATRRANPVRSRRATYYGFRCALDA